VACQALWVVHHPKNLVSCSLPVGTWPIGQPRWSVWDSCPPRKVNRHTHDGTMGEFPRRVHTTTQWRAHCSHVWSGDSQLRCPTSTFQSHCKVPALPPRSPSCALWVQPSQLQPHNPTVQPSQLHQTSQQFAITASPHSWLVCQD
jgi:hypothetical protein